MTIACSYQQLNNTVQQIETHGNKHGAHYAGLIESDERWKTVYLIWPNRSGFLDTPIFDFLSLGGSLARTGCAINVNFLPKFQKFNNLFKTGKFCLDIQKIVKFCHFLVIFPTKTRHNFAVMLATSILGTRIGQLSKFSGSCCEDIRVRIWNRAYNGNFHLIQEAWFFYFL